MNPFETMQADAQKYFERVTEANKKAWELNSEFMKKDFERQAAYYNEVAEAGRAFYENMSKVTLPATGSQEQFAKQFEAMQQRYAEIVKEQAAEYQALQNQLKDVYAPVVPAAAPQPAKSESKAK